MIDDWKEYWLERQKNQSRKRETRQEERLARRRHHRTARRKARNEIREDELMKCSDCSNPAEWERRTQFAGNHPFCEECAKKEEEDFKKDGESYFYWCKIEKTA